MSLLFALFLYHQMERLRLRRTCLLRRISERHVMIREGADNEQNY